MVALDMKTFRGQSQPRKGSVLNGKSRYGGSLGNVLFFYARLRQRADKARDSPHVFLFRAPVVCHCCGISAGLTRFRCRDVRGFPVLRDEEPR